MIAERLTGLSVERLERDELEREVMRGSQTLRTYQSRVSLALVTVVGLAYLISFHDRTATLPFALWTAAMIGTTAVRSWVCTRMERNLDAADAPRLMRNEVELFASGIVMPTIVGLGYWIVCLPGDERTVFAVTLLSAVYSIGTTINSAAQVRPMPWLLLVNLGQGVLFFAGLGNRDEPAIALLLAAMLLLELSFAKRNGHFFRASVRTRLEHAEQNRKLEENRIVVERALETALEASRSKSRFLAAASHDLRQPLHAITLYLGSLHHNAEHERQRELIDRATEAATVLREQFDGLLDLSSFDAGGVVALPQRVRLERLLARGVESLEPAAHAKGLALTLDAEPLDVTLDPMLFERLMGNLLGNAVKYTHAGRVEVRARAAGDGVHARIEVRDTGVGIPEGDRQRIFEDFAQLDNPGRLRSQGTGLGLAIVRRIAELLDMRIEVESAPGTGTRFVLTLPLEAAGDVVEGPELYPAATRAMRADAPLSLAGHTVLLVDDEPQVLDALQDFVATRGGEPVTAASPEHAATELERRAIDFAIVDDMLGDGRGGLELARRIADEYGTENVIVVTGSESTGRLREIRSSGIDVYRKPLTAEQLDDILAERLGIERAVTRECSPVDAARVQPEPLPER